MQFNSSVGTKAGTFEQPREQCVLKFLEYLLLNKCRTLIAEFLYK
jgi:hypothetical protein